MRWISDKFDFKNMVVFSIGLTGYGLLLKGIFEILKMLFKKQFSNFQSVITYGDVFLMIAIIAGFLLMFYKSFTSPESSSQEEENRKQLFYKMIMILMLLAAVLSYRIEVLTTVIVSLKSTTLILFGIIVLLGFSFLKKVINK